KECNLAEFGKVIALTAKGEHYKHPNVIYRKAKNVKISTNDVVHINLDGEYGGDAPAEFENLMRHIEVFVPINDIRKEDRI
ncbi:MAG: diacylglycerol kinase, partial [Lysinibacillus sp.]